MSDLNRFVVAQNGVYEKALNEVKNGFKESHWMWYIFPQLDGLGFSEMAEFYGIRGLNEAREYLDNEILGSRLNEISLELLKLDKNDPVSIFGEIDSIKLRSSMTLFDYVSESSDNVFSKVIDKYYEGLKDEVTLSICDRMSEMMKPRLR